MHATENRPSRARMERFARGLSLWRFEHLYGVEESKLSRAERGVRSINKDEADTIASAFDIPLEELFEEQADGRFMALFPGEKEPAA